MTNRALVKVSLDSLAYSKTGQSSLFALFSQNFGTEERAFCSFSALSCASCSRAAGSSRRTIKLLRSHRMAPSLRRHIFCPTATNDSIAFAKPLFGESGLSYAIDSQLISAGVFAFIID